MANNADGHSGTGSKKIRMTMACERCRSKKVKCDFAHPVCSRCQQAKASCSYDGSPTQIDLFNLVKLNETVDVLQERVRSIETNLKDVCTNTEFLADRFRTSPDLLGDSREDATLPSESTNWSLSLTPKGLRIDTNIISLHELYDLLRTGMSNLSIDDGDGTQSMASSSESSTKSFSTSDTAAIEKATVVKRKPFWKSKLKVFPLYSSWNSQTIDDAAILHPKDIPKEKLDSMIDIYAECFLCLPSPELQGSVVDRYRKGELDPMLASTIFAWTARHGAIYHDLFPGKDPNRVGQSFFENAKRILKERFAVSNVDTMHSLLIMYIYSLGEQSEHSESEAYMYLGLANRMCLDLKMHVESASQDPIVQERNRRFFGVLSFLETLCTVHSDKPFSLPQQDTDSIGFPTVMAHETGEARWRVEFMIQRFRITRIYRDIISKTAQEKPLLSTISALDKDLKDWYASLPPYFAYTLGDIQKRNFKSPSFREQACVKLNFEYNFQQCQLYSLFFSQLSGDEPPSAIDLLSREVCLRAADTIVELLECWAQLRQRWCHFSLETLMAAVMVYGAVLAQDIVADMNTAKRNLASMAHVLVGSPVEHHKYVIVLLDRIRRLFADYGHGSLDTAVDELLTSTTSATPLQSHKSIKRERSYQEDDEEEEIRQDVISAGPTPSDFTLTSTPASMLSTADFYKHPALHPNAGLLQFSDFLYTPILMGSPGCMPTGLDGKQQSHSHSHSHPPHQQTQQRLMAPTTSSPMGNMMPNQPPRMHPPGGVQPADHHISYSSTYQPSWMESRPSVPSNTHHLGFNMSSASHTDQALKSGMLTDFMTMDNDAMHTHLQGTQKETKMEDAYNPNEYGYF